MVAHEVVRLEVLVVDAHDGIDDLRGAYGCRRGVCRRGVCSGVQAGCVQRGAGWVGAGGCRLGVCSGVQAGWVRGVCRLGVCGGVQAVTASSATFCRKAACLLTYLLTYLLT